MNAFLGEGGLVRFHLTRTALSYSPVQGVAGVPLGAASVGGR